MNILDHKVGIIIVACLISGLGVLGTTSHLMTFENPLSSTNWNVAAFSSHVVLFVTSCMAVNHNILFLITSSFGDSGSFILNTLFFQANHLCLGIFYLTSSTCFLTSLDYSIYPYSQAKGQALTGIMLGVVSGAAHLVALLLTRITRGKLDVRNALRNGPEELNMTAKELDNKY